MARCFQGCWVRGPGLCAAYDSAQDPELPGSRSCLEVGLNSAGTHSLQPHRCALPPGRTEGQSTAFPSGGPAQRGTHRGHGTRAPVAGRRPVQAESESGSLQRLLPGGDQAGSPQKAETAGRLEAKMGQWQSAMSWGRDGDSLSQGTTEVLRGAATAEPAV